MFWGIEVTSAGVKFVPPFTLHITSACLGANLKASEERNVLQIKVDGTNHCVCSLKLGGQEHTQLDTILEEGKEVSFSVAGKNPIHLTGYFVDSMLNDENDDDQEDSDEEMDEKALLNGASDSEDDDEDFDDEDDSEDDDEEDFEIGEDDEKALKAILASAADKKRKSVEQSSNGKQQPTKQIKLDDSSKKPVTTSTPQKQQPQKQQEKQQEKTTPVKSTTSPAKPAAASPKQQAKKEEIGGKLVTLKSGLQYQDVQLGSGPAVVSGKNVTVHYTGKLQNGKVFDSSVRSGKPFTFRLGAGDVIKGWDMGVAGMKVGGKRMLVIPSALGYGNRASGPIPANSTLLFEVEVLKGGK